MQVLVATEHHFVKSPSGDIFSASGGREYPFWQRYLEAFDEVLVLGRVALDHEVVTLCGQANGLGVRFAELPDYNGPSQYISRYQEIRKQVDKTAFILVYQANRMYSELDQKDSAIQEYNRVIELFPQSRWAEVARQRISEIQNEQTNNSKGDLI